MIWIPQPTNDGSFTFFSEEFGEEFHGRRGAKAEAFQKSGAATDLVERAQQPTLRLLDVCYGLGYNTAAALETIWRVNPDCRVEIYALELDATVPLAAIAPPLLQAWSPSVQAVLTAIAHTHTCITPLLNAKLLIGDARQTIRQLLSQFQAEVIFFDPFSPRACPQLWTIEFFTLVAQCLASTGKLATYSRSAAVRSALLAAGLQIGSIPLSKDHLAYEWSQGTVAALTTHTLPTLSPMEQEHLKTRAAVPYRDPSLTDPAPVILQRHKQEQARSSLEFTTRWRRRWGIR
jgi:tRNA U34 5-methylaminomethyl-2-thiouridine-forming methyltransferase MnmC